MKRVLLTAAITVVVNTLLASHVSSAQQRLAGNKSERRQILTGPALESATEDSAIVRWTANSGESTATHYGIVRYGTDPRNLDRTARSPNRWNRSQPNMTYRVRMDGLTPRTTYYFTVDVAPADGIGLGLKSGVNRFTTRPRP